MRHRFRALLLIAMLVACGGRMQDDFVAPPDASPASAPPAGSFVVEDRPPTDPCPGGSVPESTPAGCDWSRFAPRRYGDRTCPPKLGVGCDYLWLRLAPGDDPNRIPRGFRLVAEERWDGRDVEGALAIWDDPAHGHLIEFDETILSAGCEALRRFPRAKLECEQPR